MNIVNLELGKWSRSQSPWLIRKMTGVLKGIYLHLFGLDYG